eukprot:TRINITY_DN2735_c0_g1_i2.p1 TRINITY_DN2735_c0_g1~~TRINITY_DN2735_c0_g1_i2.p1  ORF type:complete len:418 (-),score=48.59 TRINITY_DN2735_c0_g1_i2:114-1367(-)
MAFLLKRPASCSTAWRPAMSRLASLYSPQVVSSPAATAAPRSWPPAWWRPAATSTAAPPLPPVSWIGVGAMGTPMARRLVNVGVHLRVFDASPDAVGTFIDSLPSSAGHVHAATSLQDVLPPPLVPAEHGDSPVDSLPLVLITMLPSPAAVTSTIKALLPRAPRGAVLVDMSTIPPDVSRSLASLVAAPPGGQGGDGGGGVVLLDAPVSGGTAAAAAGSLTIMAGGPANAVAAVTPLLSQLGKPTHVGAAGAGQVVKAANNLVLGVSMAAVAEATALAAAAGVPPAVTAAVMGTSSGQCWASEVYHPAPGVVAGAPAGRGYTGGFRVELMRKDLGIALGMGGGGRRPRPWLQPPRACTVLCVRTGGRQGLQWSAEIRVQARGGRQAYPGCRSLKWWTGAGPTHRGMQRQRMCFASNV